MSRAIAAQRTPSGDIALRFEFDPALITFVRTLPGIRYDTSTRRFVVSPEGFSMLAEVYPERIEIGDDLRTLIPKPLGYVNPTSVFDKFKPHKPTFAGTYDAHDHQATGSTWLVKNNGFLLDDMGLGKSKQFIDAVSFEHDVLNNPQTAVLIVCKASNIDTWAAEIAKFCKPQTYMVNVYRGPKRSYTRADNPWKEFVIMSYETLRRDYTGLPKAWTWICLDEGHAIKSNPLNAQSEIARIIHYFWAPHRTILTGTPMPNSVDELYNQLLWLGYETRSWDRYEAEVLNTIEISLARKTRKKVVGYKPIGLRSVRTQLSKCVVRRMKADVLNLPPKIRTNVPVMLTPAETKLYLGAEEELRLYLDTHPGASFSQIAESSLMLRLKQITSNYRLFSAGPLGAKILWTLDKIEEATEAGHKVIVFSGFRGVIDELVPLTMKHNPAVITGDIATTLRATMIDTFQQNPQCKVFLGTLAACRYGFTLTAADIVIFIDVDWSEDYNEQNEDRAYRIGQKHTVNVYRLQAQLPDGRETFDTALEELLMKKLELRNTTLREAT